METSEGTVAPPFSAADAEELLDFFGDHESFFDVEMTPSLPVTDCVVMAPPSPPPTTAHSPAAAGAAFKLEAPTLRFASAVSSPPSARASDADSPPRSRSETTVKKKSAFQRQKEELAYLHSKVAELEVRLRNLRGMDRPSGASEISEEPAELEQSLRQVAASLSLWQSVAKHKQSERNRAEQENVELRKLLKEHAGLAKSLKRMLRKRMVAFPGLQATEPQRHQEISEKDSEVFQALRRSVEDRAANVDELFASLGLTPVTTNLNTTRVVASDDDGKQEHVELVNAILLAFDFRALSETIWRLLTSKYEREQVRGKPNNLVIIMGICTEDPPTESRVLFVCHDSLRASQQDHEVTFGDNIVFKKQQVPLKADPDDHSAPGSTVVFAVYKQVSYENRMVLLWERLIERNESASSGIPVVYLSQFGCGQILRMDGVSTRDRTRTPMALAQSYVQIKPLQMKPRVGLQHVQRGITTLGDAALSMDTIIETYQQGRQEFLHVMESELDGLVRDIGNMHLEENQ